MLRGGVRIRVAFPKCSDKQNMNAAAEAIEESREVRRRISSEHGRGVARYLSGLRAEENQHTAQTKRGAELLGGRRRERRKNLATTPEALALRDQPRS